MSQLAAPTRVSRPSSRGTSMPRRVPRASRQASARPVIARTPGATKVETVPAAHRSGPGFALCIFAMAFAAAIALLMLNTMRAEQSFTVSKLQNDVSVLQERQQALNSEIDAVSAPENLAMKADQYGMVPAASVTYMKNGKKVGTAGSPLAGQAITVDTLPDTPASKAADQVLSAGTIGLHVTDPVAKAAADAKAKSEAAAKAAAKKDTKSGSGK